VEVQRLVEEQAALRRVATLVARGVEPAETFSAVSDEVAQLFAASGLVLRFEEDGTGIVSVGVSTGNDIPAGAHWNFEEGMASLEVYRTGRSARVDAFDWSSASGPAAETAERVGIVSSVSNPILVQSRLWGAITVFSTSERLPDETEDRLERFSQLVATAIANAESREAVSRTRHALERVAAEQAALRRVATLVAQGVAPAEVFSAATQEVAAASAPTLTCYGKPGSPARVSTRQGRLLQERRVRNAGLAADPVDEEHHLVDVAPAPVFARLE
jgi:transcriptional regulator with GAF, ATPase, and Fis domain